MTPKVSITTRKAPLSSDNHLLNRSLHPGFIITVEFNCLQGKKSIPSTILSEKSEASSSTDPPGKTEFQSHEVNHSQNLIQYFAIQFSVLYFNSICVY